MSQRKNFRLKSETSEYIEQYAKENNISQTEAIEKIVTEYRVSHDSAFASLVAEKVADKLTDTLTRIRLASRSAEKNTMVQMELWNTLLIQNDITNLLSTESHKAAVLKSAEDTVTERIANWRQAKLSKKNTKNEQ